MALLKWPFAKRESPAPAPQADDQATVWVPENGGGVYHARGDCYAMLCPREIPLSRAKELGLKPCKKCGAPK